MTDDPFWNGVAVLYWWFVFVPMLAVATAILVFTLLRVRDHYRFLSRK
jgi:hypothetical protein